MNARVATVAGLLLILASAAQAQESSLDQVLEELNSKWARGDAAAIVRTSAENGITFELDGESIGPLSTRQATAVLKKIFEGRTTLSVQRGLARDVGGSPARAFIELAWTTRASGTTVPERVTVLFALTREQKKWRITKIRIIE